MVKLLSLVCSFVFILAMSANAQWLKTSTNPNALAHDIHADSVLQPVPNSRTPIAVPTDVSIRISNAGTSDEQNVPLCAVVRDTSRQIVYRDTVFVPNWSSGVSLDTTFSGWTPANNEYYSIQGEALLTSDEDRTNDTVKSSVLVAYENDVQADSVVNPQPSEVKQQGSRWFPSAYFENVGAADLFNVPVRAEITRTSDGQRVFETDSIIPELHIDDHKVLYQAPSREGPFNVASLIPGCYDLYLIAKYSTDGDRTNDTARTTFCIGANGSVGDIATEPSEALSIIPNPVSQSAVIRFTSLETTTTRVSVLNLLGVEVATLLNGTLEAGEHSFTWDARGVAPGMYSCLVRANGKTQSVGMMLLR